MSPRLVATGRTGPAFASREELAESRHQRGRRVGGSHYVVTDAGLYAPRRRSSDELRAAADAELLRELEASVVEGEE